MLNNWKFIVKMCRPLGYILRPAWVTDVTVASTAIGKICSKSKAEFNPFLCFVKPCMHCTQVRLTICPDSQWPTCMFLHFCGFAMFCAKSWKNCQNVLLFAHNFIVSDAVLHKLKKSYIFFPIIVHKTQHKTATIRPSYY